MPTNNPLLAPGIILACLTTCVCAAGSAQVVARGAGGCARRLPPNPTSRRRFLSALGLSLQRAGHLRLAPARAASPHARVRSFTSVAWSVGLACIVSSALLSLGVSALLGQFLASSFAALTLVWAALLRHFMLQERLTLRDVSVILLLVGGTLQIVFGRTLGASGGTATFLSPASLQQTLASWRTALFVRAAHAKALRPRKN